MSTPAAYWASEYQPELRADGKHLADHPAWESEPISDPALAPRVDTTKTAKPTRAHILTLGGCTDACTITLEEWHRRND